MRSRQSAVLQIVNARIQLVLTGESSLMQDFGDASKVNRIAEIYGGTYTQAWDEVRAVYKQQIKKIAEKVDN